MNNVSNTVQVAPVAPKTFQGKWGYYPCDRETFLKLKQLNKVYEKALRQEAAWNRWNKKSPQNRVLRRWKRDASGRRIGCEIVGPAPEPALTSAMMEVSEKAAQKWGTYTVPAYRFITWKCVNILQEYRNARYPKSTPESVKPLSITIDKIDALLKECGE